MKTRVFEGFEFQVLEPAESWSQAMPRFGQVFLLDEIGELNDHAIFPKNQLPRIFRDPNWQAVALVDDPVSSEDEESLKGKPDWYRDLHGRDHLAPLLGILQERQTPYIYLAHTDRSDLLETLLVSPQQKAMDAAWLSDHLLSMLCSFAVDDRADWGLVIDENVMFLGGEPALMERFIAESGGMDELTRLFSLYIEETATPDDPNYLAAPASFYRRVYTYCGWDWPFPEPPTAPERAEQAET